MNRLSMGMNTAYNNMTVYGSSTFDLKMNICGFPTLGWGIGPHEIPDLFGLKIYYVFSSIA